jgi:aryl-alcohol dehydrogenase-like predicted oxidoreductase
MKFRTLGKWDLKLSCLGLGGNIYGRFCDEKATFEILRHAADFGVNLVDTADVYSDGLSEEYIGRAVKGQRASWIIATKLGVYSGESMRGKAGRSSIRIRIEGSLRRLGTDYIDVYQLHHWDDSTPLEETAAALEDLVREGKIRYSGVSNCTAQQVKDFARLCEKSRPAAVQTAYNLFKREPDDGFFPICRETGIGVLAYAVLARGILSSKYLDGNIPKGSRAAESASIRSDLNTNVIEVVAALERFAGQMGGNVQQLALLWALRRTEVASLLVGVRSPAQLSDAVSALNMSMEEGEWQTVDELVGDMGQYENSAMGSFDIKVDRRASRE